MSNRYWNKDGKTWMEPSDGIFVSDYELMAMFRGIETKGFGGEHVCRSFDVRYLQPLLYFLARTHHAKTVVEIGTADGSTTWPLLKAVGECGGTLHSVDVGPCIATRKLIAATPWATSWRFHEEPSDTFFHTGDGHDLVIDAAFVDGDHSCAGVMSDARNILDRLVPGGFVIFHEWGDCPPIEEIGDLPTETTGPTGDDLSCRYGTQRALRAMLPNYDVDVMPLNFGACGPDRYPNEWTEGGAIMVRKRAPGEFVARLS